MNKAKNNGEQKEKKVMSKRVNTFNCYKNEIMV